MARILMLKRDTRQTGVQTKKREKNGRVSQVILLVHKYNFFLENQTKLMENMWLMREKSDENVQILRKYFCNY